MNKYFIISLIIAVAYLLKGCANVSSPTGGKKDETPPKVARILPADKSRNFTGQTIELAFDEYIQVDNIKQELLITPDIEGTYEVKPLKNGLRLVFNKPFLPNTTYTLNFRKAIKDVTEKNVADNVKLVFSTGPYLDSLYIRGNVTDLFTGKPTENTVVSLYRTADTLDILKHKPFYFTKTDKSGNYLLENIKGDTYRIYALEDKNNNLKYDGLTQQKEKVALRPEPITLDSSRQNIDFTISPMDAVAPKITGRSAAKNFFELQFDEGLQKGSVEFANVSSKPVYQLIEKGKTLRVYNTVNQTDSIQIQVTALDSTGNELKQNVSIKFQEASSKQREGSQRKEKFDVKTDPADGEKVLRDLTYHITFSKPITSSDLTRIQLLDDTIKNVPLEAKDFTWNEYNTKLSLNKKIQARGRVRLLAPAGTFISVEGDTASQIKTTHELKDSESYGIISGKIETKEPHFIIQLLNPNSEVVAEIRNQTAYRFNYLDAGEYIIRVIIDKNNNGRWDQGSLSERRQPEPIIFAPRTFKLKENWELTDQNITL